MEAVTMAFIKRKTISFVLLLMAVAILIFSLRASLVRAKGLAEDIPVEADGTGITIYFFWGDGCPHCENAWSFFHDSLLVDYPGIVIADYETWADAANQAYYQEMAEAYDGDAMYVPAIFIGDFQIIGYSEAIGEEIQGHVETYIAVGSYPNPADRVQGSVVQAEPTPEPSPIPEPTPEPSPIPEPTPVPEPITETASAPEMLSPEAFLRVDPILLVLIGIAALLLPLGW